MEKKGKNEKKNSKKIILLLVLLLVLGIAIGYTTLSQDIRILGTSNIVSDWDVKIIGITAGANNATNGATNTTAPTFTDTTATFSVDLAYPGAVGTYDITVKNNGQVDAILKSVTGTYETVNAQDPTSITFSINAAADDELNVSETKTYTVTATWNANDTQIPEIKTKSATFILNYEQAN